MCSCWHVEALPFVKFWEPFPSLRPHWHSGTVICGLRNILGLLLMVYIGYLLRESPQNITPNRIANFAITPLKQPHQRTSIVKCCISGTWSHTPIQKIIMVWFCAFLFCWQDLTLQITKLLLLGQEQSWSFFVSFFLSRCFSNDKIIGDNSSSPVFCQANTRLLNNN